MPHSGAHGTQRTEIKTKHTHYIFSKNFSFLKVVVYS